jgi:predicted RNA binding protein YcfA (HicA-like mRNA interferase family)
MLRKAGFYRDHQKGSHLVMLHPDGRRAVVPMHVGDMKKGTAIGILKSAGLWG